MDTNVWKLCFYVPASHVEAVKDAVFGAGAGRLGNYDRCCWQSGGQGQFRPLSGSHPHLGERGRVHVEPEIKVEMLCRDECLETALAALKGVHPYETPAFETWPVSI
ncbi:MAG: NGG1p interacting factor NIF3 [Verrucomicrobiota bacterium]